MTAIEDAASQIEELEARIEDWEKAYAKEHELRQQEEQHNGETLFELDQAYIDLNEAKSRISDFVARLKAAETVIEQADQLAFLVEENELYREPAFELQDKIKAFLTRKVP